MLKKFSPRVKRHTLYLLAGSLWTIVGLMLIIRALDWLLPLPFYKATFLALTGVVTGFFLARPGFQKLVAKNISRINTKPETACVFEFQSAKSYFLIVFMILLGVTLRHSSFPRTYLAIIYLTIGLGLFLSSFKYYLNFNKNKN
jgi:uncharacterized membrane protein